MTHRDTNPKALIILTVIDQKGDTWGDETRKVARADAQRILEALIAEYGVEKAVLALDGQGLKGGAYRYLLKPLHEEAQRRRQQLQA